MPARDETFHGMDYAADIVTSRRGYRSQHPVTLHRLRFSTRNSQEGSVLILFSVARSVSFVASRKEMREAQDGRETPQGNQTAPSTPSRYGRKPTSSAGGRSAQPPLQRQSKTCRGAGKRHS